MPVEVAENDAFTSKPVPLSRTMPVSWPASVRSVT